MIYENIANLSFCCSIIKKLITKVTMLDVNTKSNKLHIVSGKKFDIQDTKANEVTTAIAEGSTA